MSSISTDQISESVAELRRQVESLRAQIAGQMEELQRAERELALMTELARLRTTPDGPAGTPEQLLADVAAPNGTGATRLIEAVLAALRFRGQAMHIQELVASVKDAGVEIPGKGEPANLISHIRNHPEIVRPVRGMYGLREWGLTERAAISRRRSKKPRGRATRRRTTRNRGLPS